MFVIDLCLETKHNFSLTTQHGLRDFLQKYLSIDFKHLLKA